ncbi:MAG: 50S ribosomal protein L17 [Spirochaetota bacterium]|nr:50S ribosomal protein L17 [Spirochaetota bacterium]
MRHKIEGRKLGRSSAHRKAMFANMATSLFKYERIKTTLAKAKELKRFIEPLITRAKEESLHNKRLILKKIKNRKILIKLFENIAPRFKNRPGGYTRIIQLGFRKGDNSKLAFIELVEEALKEDVVISTTEKPADTKKTKNKEETSKDKKEKSSIKAKKTSDKKQKENEEKQKPGKKKKSE